MSGFDDPFWNSKQVVAWVAFKDRDLVAVTDSVTIDRLKYTDDNGRRKSLPDAITDLIYNSDGKEEAKKRFSKAVDEIRRALKSGKIVASYLPVGSRQRIEAGKLFWIDNDFYFFTGTFIHTSRGAEFHDYEIRFDAEEIRRKWPIASAPVAQRRAAGKAAFEALCEMMCASLNHRPRPQERILGDLMKSIPGLSEREALKQWFRAIDETGAEAWSAPGRPANKPKR